MTKEQHAAQGKLITQRGKKEVQLSEHRKRAEEKSDAIQKKIDQLNFQIREIANTPEQEIRIELNQNKTEDE